VPTRTGVAQCRPQLSISLRRLLNRSER
jgi:hypothetical protein